MTDNSRDLQGGLPGPQPTAGGALPLGATVTIFFSDIRGFTEYTNQYGDEAAYRALQEHNSLVSRQIELFGGRTVKTQGDSFMVYFPTARAAIRCSVSIQRAPAAHAASQRGTGMALGIGINTGEPIQEGGDLFGTAVNLAARICAAAGPGQVLVSETTRFVAGRIDGVEFIDQGLRDLKGFPEPQRLFEVRWTQEEGAARASASEEFRSEAAALSERFALLGVDLLGASRAMQQGGDPPNDALTRQLAVLREAFADLRARVIERATAAGVNVAGPDTMLSLGALEPVLAALAEAEANPVAGAEPEPVTTEDRRSRQAALEAAVQRAIVVLNRVLVVRHHDDPAFQPLMECQAKASELRLTLSRIVAQNPGYSVQRVDEAMLPFADLVGLIIDRDNLDDERFAQLEGGVSRLFGRPLAVAAARGRLFMEGAEPRPTKAAASVPENTLRSPAPAAPSSPSVPTARAAVSLPTAPSTATAPVAAVDPRAADVRWWVAANTGWATWKASELAFAHGIRVELAQCPHLLSVPIQDSTGGYYLLLEHADRVTPGCLRQLVDLAAAEGGGETMSRRLYRALATQANLPETYPDFLRDVIVAVIPSPGVWADAGIVESPDATIVITRPHAEIGLVDERVERLTESKDRFVEHRFALTLAPLTARFVYVKGVELKDPRDVAVKVTDDGEPSGQAWVLVQHTGYVAAPRRLEPEGVTLPGMAKNYSAVWVALFNTEPHDAKHYEVTLSLKPQSILSAARRSAFAPGTR